MEAEVHAALSRQASMEDQLVRRAAMLDERKCEIELQAAQVPLAHVLWGHASSWGTRPLGARVLYSLGAHIL